MVAGTCRRRSPPAGSWGCIRSRSKASRGRPREALLRERMHPHDPAGGDRLRQVPATKPHSASTGGSRLGPETVIKIGHLWSCRAAKVHRSCRPPVRVMKTAENRSSNDDAVRCWLARHRRFKLQGAVRPITVVVAHAPDPSPVLMASYPTRPHSCAPLCRRGAPCLRPLPF